MNRIYRSIWNDHTGTFVAASENVKSGGRKSSPVASALAPGMRFALNGLALALMLAFAPNLYAAPSGGAVAAGSASIAASAGKTTINQASQNVAINWQSFSIGQKEAVQFVQPNSSSVALNRVLGSDPSNILGSLSANGKVFLVNPSGILFGQGAQVNVGGLVASTLNISDSDFMAGKYNFSGAGKGAVLNQGTINADGGYVALLGANVSNEGVISARLGTVALAAGNAMTLDVAGDGLLNVTVTQGAVNALVHNGGLIQADGGQVLLTTQAAGNLLQSVINNTGVIQAQTIENRNGTIRLLGDMQSGTLNAGGILDASAPNGGNGGFIETSAAHVNIANDAKITTAASTGVTGRWLIDPIDFTIAELGGDIAGTTLSGLLVSNNITISTVVTGTNTATALFAAPGQGNINVNSPIGVGAPLWTATPNTTTLTLNAVQDVNINAAITATNGNLVACCGRDVNVRAAITTTGGSVLLAAGRDVTLFTGSAMTTTNGNIELCAGRDVLVNSKITLTNSGSIPSQGLGLPLGLTLSAGNNATAPGVGGGTVTLPVAGDPLRPTVTRSAAPVTDIIINYNPTAYTAPHDYSTQIIFDPVQVKLTQHMLVFPGGANKVVDGNTLASFTTLVGSPVGVTLVAGTANFDTALVGTGKTITYSGFGLSGASAGNFALPVACCGPAVRTTTGDITPIIAAPVPPIVPIVPAPVVPPAVVTPPFSPPPVVTPPAVVEVPPAVVAIPPLAVVTSGGTAPIALVPVPPQVGLSEATEQFHPELNLAVVGTGVRMPPEQLAQRTVIPPPPLPPPAPPVIVVPPAPPSVYVPPVRPPRPSRN